MLAQIALAAVLVGATGIIIGFFLCISAKKLYVETDPREEAIIGCLPGNNCGGCGYAGCSGLAAAIVKGEAPVNGCPVGGDSVGAKVGEIMGVKAEAGAKKVAFVKCIGDCEKAMVKYDYTGVEDCSMMAYAPDGGPKGCRFGCMGFGSCVKACPFDAIHVENGIAKVDYSKCKACGKCVAACPRKLIELIPYDAPHVVACSSLYKGKAVMDLCKAGCIGCGLCEKNCEQDAIHVVENLAHIDQDKCTGCGKCAEKCPKKVIL